MAFPVKFAIALETSARSGVVAGMEVTDMQNDDQAKKSSEAPAEGANDIPPPERGSPRGDKKPQHDDAAKRTEKGEDADPNPLAPPVNTQAGS